jgi:hypothetical protein
VACNHPLSSVASAFAAGLTPTANGDSISTSHPHWVTAVSPTESQATVVGTGKGVNRRSPDLRFQPQPYAASAFAVVLSATALARKCAQKAKSAEGGKDRSPELGDASRKVPRRRTRPRPTTRSTRPTRRRRRRSGGIRGTARRSAAAPTTSSCTRTTTTPSSGSSSTSTARTAPR